MLQYDTIDASEWIGINKTGASKECIICCHYWYFKDVGYKFEPHVGNSCHDILMMVYELKNITIMNVKGVDYGCVLWNMTRNDAINMLGNSKLDDKGTLCIWILEQMKHPLKGSKKAHLEELILETSILVLIVNGTESRGKNLMS